MDLVCLEGLLLGFLFTSFTSGCETRIANYDWLLQVDHVLYQLSLWYYVLCMAIKFSLFGQLFKQALAQCSIPRFEVKFDFGTFLYGLIERALLPFGLHHGLNWPVRTTELGGSWTIGGNHVVGTVNAYLASLADSSIKSIAPSITRFNGGKFVYFMFGLSGAAYAMYRQLLQKT